MLEEEFLAKIANENTNKGLQQLVQGALRSSIVGRFKSGSITSQQSEQIQNFSKWLDQNYIPPLNDLNKQLEQPAIDTLYKIILPKDDEQDVVIGLAIRSKTSKDEGIKDRLKRAFHLEKKEFPHTQLIIFKTSETNASWSLFMENEHGQYKEISTAEAFQAMQDIIKTNANLNGIQPLPISHQESFLGTRLQGEEPSDLISTPEI